MLAGLLAILHEGRLELMDSRVRLCSPLSKFFHMLTMTILAVIVLHANHRDGMACMVEHALEVAHVVVVVLELLDAVAFQLSDLAAHCLQVLVHILGNAITVGGGQVLADGCNGARRLSLHTRKLFANRHVEAGLVDQLPREVLHLALDDDLHRIDLRLETALHALHLGHEGPIDVACRGLHDPLDALHLHDAGVNAKLEVRVLNVHRALHGLYLLLELANDALQVVVVVLVLIVQLLQIVLPLAHDAVVALDVRGQVVDGLLHLHHEGAVGQTLAFRSGCHAFR